MEKLEREGDPDMNMYHLCSRLTLFCQLPLSLLLHITGNKRLWYSVALTESLLCVGGKKPLILTKMNLTEACEELGMRDGKAQQK